MSRHLEDGLFELATERIRMDKGFQKIAINKNFDRMDYNLFQEYRLYQLKKTLERAFQISRFYRKLYKEHGVSADDIQSISDISKLPFTFPSDLGGKNFEFLCISQAGVEKPVSFYSSGTTGLKKQIYFSEMDTLKILKFLSRGMNTVIEKEKGRIQIFLQNTSGRGAANILKNSVESYGMKAWVSDIEIDTSEEMLKLCKENKTNVWFGDVFSILRFTKEMEHKVDLSDLGVKVLFLTMSNISDSMIAYLEKVWGCYISTHYGLTEMGWGLAVDCDTCNGYHYNELDVIAEVVNPKTGEVLPDGEVGELTFTSIGREAMPLIRYRSGDISSLSNPICGHHLKVMQRILRRIEGAYQLNEEEFIYPALIEEELYKVDEVVDYRVKADKSQLYFDVEVTDIGNNGKTKEIVIQEIISYLKNVPAINNCNKIPIISLLELGTLRKYCFEKKRIQTIEK